MRPLGIPDYEDKLVQGAMRKVLDQIYEWRFYDFSFGFRKVRNCHQAIREINQTVMTKKVNFVVDADVKGFFDNVSHKWLMKFLEHDIQDKNFLRYIVRFLKSGMTKKTLYTITLFLIKANRFSKYTAIFSKFHVLKNI